MANPDFDKIRASNFTEFHYENSRRLSKISNHANNLKCGWKEVQWFFSLSFTVEHLNYKRWLKVLQQNNKAAHFCFDWNATYSGTGDYSFMEAYDWDSTEDIPEQKSVIADGLNIFKETFGEISRSFIAPCYNWDPSVEVVLKEHGVEWIQGLRSQLIPTGTFDQYTYLRHTFGETNSLGIKYNIRIACLSRH
ncbi:MAG: hypothetical protein IPN80_03065 [Flavobacterium sp.]|nr:hypothetical protein [Flavobacterium sp.]